MSVQNPKPSWAVSFNIDDQTWIKLCQASKQKQWSPLALALESKLLDETHFLNWERQNSQMPALKPDFFNGAPPLELFNKFNFTDCQISSSMPVTDWNGQIYWAKISTEKSPFETDGSKALWFLAPWSGMKKWFAIWEKEVDVIPPTVIPPALEMAMAPPPQAAKILPQSAVQSPAMPILQNTIPYTPPTIDPAEELANIFEFGDPDTPLSSSFTKTEVKVLPEIPPDVIPPNDPSHQLEVPSEALSPEFGAEPEKTFVEPRVETMILETGIRQAPPNNTEVVSGINISMTNEPLALEEAESPVGLGIFNSEATSAMDFSSLLQHTAEPEISLNQSPVKLEMEMPNMAQPESPQSIAATMPPAMPMPATYSPVIQPISASQNNIETIPAEQFEKCLRAAQNQDSLAEVLLGVWQNYFSQIMILLFQQDRLIMWWSNEKFSAFKKGDTISLEAPSVFRIVSTTASPYHGHIMPSPENDRFFQMVNSGQYPQHLTLVPVLAGDRVVAMLLGTCTSEESKKITLPRLEDDAKIFATTLFKITATARQAS